MLDIKHSRNNKRFQQTISMRAKYSTLQSSFFKWLVATREEETHQSEALTNRELVRCVAAVAV